MLSKSFEGGKHIESHKELTFNKAIVDMPLPKQVVIPLSQHTGSPCEPLVKKGDAVKVGMKIGQGKGLITSCVHASISGIINDIIETSHPVLGTCRAVVIDGDGKDEKDASIVVRPKPETLSKEELLEIIKEAGIVGLGGAAFPAQVKLNPPKPIDTLIINAAECEPYLTCDYRLVLEKTANVLLGILLIKKIVGAKDVVIGVEDDKPEALSALRNKIVEKSLPIRVELLETKYPQGAEKQLIKALVDREVPPGKLPFDVSVVVSNVGSAFAVYEAVYQGKPLYERVITVSGENLKKPGNLRVRIGTRFSEVIAFCEGTRKPVAKIIMGGPMMGIAQCLESVPVIKGTSGILLFSEDEVKNYEPGPCIRCGRCVDICPMGMLPYMFSLIVDSGAFAQAANYNPKDCMECGSCVFICPAKRRILESIKLVKTVLK